MTGKFEIGGVDLDAATNTLAEAIGVIQLAADYAERHTGTLGTALVTALSAAQSLVNEARDRLIDQGLPAKA